MMSNIKEEKIEDYYFIPTCRIPRDEPREIACSDCMKEVGCSLRSVKCNDFDVKFTSLWKID